MIGLDDPSAEPSCNVSYLSHGEAGIVRLDVDICVAYDDSVGGLRVRLSCELLIAGSGYGCRFWNCGGYVIGFDHCELLRGVIGYFHGLLDEHLSL